MSDSVKTGRHRLFLLLAGAALLAILAWLVGSLPFCTTAYAQSGTGTIRVATTGSDVPGCGSAAGPCRTVQYAVDQVVAGDDVLIATGVYTNPDMAVQGRLVYVHKSLTLAGGYTPSDWSTPDPTANPTVLDGESLGQVLYADTAGITVTVSGLTLQRGSNNAVYFQNARLLLQDSAVMSTTSNYALYLNNSHGSQISDSRIAHNYYGVYATNSENLVIQGNSITDNSRYGIYLGNNNISAAVSENTVTGNGQYGVYWNQYNHYGTLTHNTITGNNYDGVWIGYNNDYVTIEANTLSDNNRRGLYLSNSNSDLWTISGNTIAGNADDGVYMYGGTGHQVDNNIIAHNYGDGVEWNTGSGTLRHNTISDNTGEAGLRVGSASLILTNTLVSGHTYGILTTGTAADVQADHTLWYNNGTNTDNSAGGTIATTNDLAGDPLFVGGIDPFTAYHISIGSAAIDAGTAAGLLVDIDGDSRPYDAGYDVGADEYPGVAAPPIGIAVSGPITGSLQIPYTFHAVVTPTTATPPITYLWQMAGQPPVIHTGTWSDSASLIGHVAGPQTITVTATNEGGTVTGTHAIVLAAPAATSFPFYDGFESGALQPGWLAQTIDQGRVQVSSYAPYAGSYSALLDDAVSDSNYSTAGLILTIDLTGQPSAVLDFWWREFGDEDHPQDGVFLSDNYGATWYQALSFNGGPQSYRREYIDLGASAAVHGLTFNDHFQIKFQFYDDLAIPNDGYAIDEVQVISALPLEGVTISGPSEGMALTSYTFTADVTPITGTPPINYVWQATGLSPITQTGGVSTEAAFTWTAAGTQVVTVTATNAVNSASDTYLITLIEPPIIEVAPLDIEETLPSDTDLEVTLTITNSGGSLLNATLSTSTAWLSVGPDAAAIPPLSSASVAVTLDAAGLVSGSYTGTVTILSNDPVNPLVAVPVIMHVGGEALPMVTPTLLDFGEVFVGFDKTLGLLVENAGASELTVFDITASDPALTASPSSFTVGGYSDRLVDVTFAPEIPQPLTATLTISTNAPTTPVLTVQVVGRAVEPPAISVEPTSFHITQGPGLVTTRPLFINNSGPGTLVFDLSITNNVVGIAPDAGSLVGPGHFTSTVTFDSTAWPAGLYTGQINITSNDPLTPTLSVPVVFTVTLAVPGAPSNPDPSPGQVGVRIDKTLAWQASLNADVYDLYLWQEGQPKPAAPTASDLAQPGYDPTGDLPTGTLFHWQVVARNAVGDTPGPEWTFTTELLPDLEVAALTVPPTASSGQPLELVWVVANSGDRSTVGHSWRERVYISTTATLDLETAIYLGQVTNRTDLAPGGSYTQTASFDLPQGISGDYYAFVLADYWHQLRELDETDNTSAPGGPVDVALTAPPDLQVTAISGPANAYAGDTIQVDWVVRNQGTGDSIGSTWSDRLYLSADMTFDAGTDTVLRTVGHSGALSAGEGYAGSVTANLPQVISGTHYLFAVTDIYDNVYEHQAEANNTSPPSDPLTIGPRPVDLSVSKTSLAPSNTGPSTSRALAGHPLTYTLTLVNVGQLAAVNVMMTDTLPPGVSFASQSSAFAFTQSDSLLNWTLGDLAAGESVVIDVVGHVVTGTIGMITNVVEATTASSESNLVNNVASLITTVETPAPVLDVSPTGPTLVVAQGASADLTVTITNIGAAGMTGITVAPPPTIPWVTVDTAGLTELAPGESATISITAGADIAQTPGYYRDYVTVSQASGGQRLIALTVRVIPPTRTLEVTVQNNQGARVSGARLVVEKQEASVIVTQGATEYYYPSAQGTTDSSGIVRLADLEVGTYDFSLTAADHEPAAGTLTVVEASGTQFETLTLVGLPELGVSPDAPVIGVVQGETAGQTIAIQNLGAAPLTGVAIAPPANLPWVHLSTPGTIPPLAPGEQVEFTIFASPPPTQPVGVYQDYVTVTADGGQTRQVALTVEVTVEQARDLRILVTDGAGNPVTNGNVTLIEQMLSTYAAGGVTTTYNEQYTARLDDSGSAMFAALRPGDYNYLISARGYEQGDGALAVLHGTGTQEVTISLTPAPFVYDWVVVPIDQGYNITLTLTYDTEATDEPAVVIPARYWAFSDCNLQPINDNIRIHNLAPISLTLTSLDISVPGVSIQVGDYPTALRPNGSVSIPVTANKTGELAEGEAEVTFSYLAVDDDYVTFTFNPSSLISPWIDSGQSFTETYLIEPVVFDPETLYALQVTEPGALDWISVGHDQAGPMHWTADSDIAVTLGISPPTWLAEGTYTDAALIRVSGDDGTWREGSLNIEVTRAGDGFQVHTSFELGPIPYVEKSGTGRGIIDPRRSGCSGDGGGWTWTPRSGGLIGTLLGGGGVPTPRFPDPVPPPVTYYGHQQVRLQISQHLMLEGEGFKASLDIDNVSASPLELVSVDIRLSDLNDADQTANFTLIPEVPTDLGTIGVGGNAAGEWLIVPSDLDVISPQGERYNVRATINYTWNGVNYSVETVPEEITVYPSPDLVITYEMPLPEYTCTVFDLKTVITNQGLGAARDIRFSSAQPAIVDNQSGLQIGFQIVEAFVNAVPWGSSLDLALGDLPPGESMDVVWRLQASLPGRFVEFTSDYRQSNYQGLPLTPLISEINTTFVRPTDESCLAAGELHAQPEPQAGEVQLVWIVPESIAMDGESPFDIRYSSSPISTTNWMSATQLVAEPESQSPGLEQSWSITETTFAIGTRWYFAMKTRDQQGNWSGLSNVPSIEETGFRPNPDGYQFGNYPNEDHPFLYPVAPPDFTAVDAALMFGADEVCAIQEPVCILRPSYAAWAFGWNWTMNFGHCYGMAATSLLFDKDWGDAYGRLPSDFQENAYTTYDLDLPWPSPVLPLNSIRRRIAHYHVKQQPTPEYGYPSSYADFLDRLYLAMSGNVPDPVILLMVDGSAGHAVTPYAVEDRGYGIFRIWVYDSNHPDTSQVVIVDTINDNWRYDAVSWSGTGATLAFVPISELLGQADCLLCEDGAAGTPFGQTWLIGEGHLLITDSEDRRIGYAGDEFVNEIPGASTQIIYAGLGAALEPIYVLPLTEDLHILLDGQTFAGTETAKVAQFGPGYAAWVEDIEVSSVSQDQLTVAPDGTQLSYQPSSQQEVSLALALDDASESYELQIEGADVLAGQAVRLIADTDNDQLEFNNAQSAGGEYDLAITRIGAEGERKFVHTGLTVSGSDTHYADYGAWDGVGSIMLHIDYSSDGSIDETMMLENQLWPLSAVVIDGPASGTIDAAYTFTATVNPISATLPISYVWQATDQTQMDHESGLSDTISFTWTTTGTKAITATAKNSGGTVFNTHVITIGAALPATVTLTADPTSIPADGVSTSTITATVHDAYDNPVPGQVVTFTTSLGSVAPVSATTDVAGLISTTLTASTTVGTAIVTAEAHPVSGTVEVLFTNVPPVVAAGPGQATDEGNEIRLLSAVFTDTNPLDAHTATVDWADATAAEAATVTEGDGTGSVSGSHTYADDGTYSVQVCVTDEHEDTTCDTLAVTIENLGPTVDTGADQSIEEGTVVNLDPATFHDAGTLDTHTATIDWGDGSGIEAGAVAESPFGPPGDPAGMDGTVAGSHVYADDGTYSVEVCVTDDDEATACDSLAVTVENLTPTLDAGINQTVDEGTLVNLDPAAFNDPGTLDAHTATIDWGDDSEVEAGAVSETPFGPPGDPAGMDGTVAGSHVYEDQGNYLVTICVTDDEDASACDELQVTVENAAPTVDAGPATQTVQYSDGIAEVTFTASDVAADSLTAVPSFGLPDYLILTDNGCIISDGTNVCTWTLSGIASVPAGEHTVWVTVSDEDDGQTDADITLTVEPEEATARFHGGNPVAVRVPDGEEESGSFDLMVRVRETYNWDTREEPTGEPRTFPGDIGLAQASMMLSPIGPGGSASPLTDCTSAVADTGYDAKLTVVCSFGSVPVNTYAVQVMVGGDYYTGYGEDVLVVYDPSLGFATGGASFYWPGTDDAASGYPGDQTNFGFTMEYNKKGQKVKGSLLLIRHREDDSIYQAKSNALYGLALGQEPDPVRGEDFGWASFSGKSTYLEPGWLDPVGNHEFIVYVEDRNEPGTGVDRFWIEVREKDRQIVLVMSMAREATDNAVDLQAGNIVVPHGGKKSR